MLPNADNDPAHLPQFAVDKFVPCFVAPQFLRPKFLFMPCLKYRMLPNFVLQSIQRHAKNLQLSAPKNLWKIPRKFPHNQIRDNNDRTL